MPGESAIVRLPGSPSHGPRLWLERTASSGGEAVRWWRHGPAEPSELQGRPAWVGSSADRLSCHHRQRCYTCVGHVCNHRLTWPPTGYRPVTEPPTFEARACCVDAWKCRSVCTGASDRLHRRSGTPGTGGTVRSPQRGCGLAELSARGSATKPSTTCSTPP